MSQAIWCYNPELGEILSSVSRALQSGTPSNTLVLTMVRQLLDQGVIDRMAARGLYLISIGKLDLRDLRQLLPQRRIRLRCVQSAADETEDIIAPLPSTSGSIGRYRIDGLLHLGPNSYVYRAWHPNLNLPVAVKMVCTGRTAQLLRNEVFFLSRITHPNILRIWDADLDAPQPYMASEYISGNSLRKILMRSPRLSVRRAFTIVYQVIRGLRAAWQAGFVHGDIKPANILIRPDNRVVIIDFGLARSLNALRTPLTHVAGTWPYLAPERLNGEGDHRADIYSLGITLYEMLAGMSLDQVGKLNSEGQQNLHPITLEPLHWINTAVNRATSRFIQQMIEHDPLKRPGSYDELLSELKRLCPLPRKNYNNSSSNTY
ncbi:MAG: serine/threonine-protein kinase [Thermogemmata sp.]|nr:serine/threonine-protein kinase [Thermogemmata sp.]